MLNKGMFINPSGGKSSGGNTSGGGTTLDGDKIVHSVVPDILIENGKVYFSKTELNAVVTYTEGKLYAEEMTV